MKPQRSLARLAFCLIAFLPFMLVFGCGSNNPPGSLSITGAGSSFAAGAAVQLLAIDTSDNKSTNVTQTATWTSSDNVVATVTNTGLVTGLKPGNATITAVYNKDSGSMALAIGQPALTAIQLTPPSAALLTNGTQQYTVNATYADRATGTITSGVTWTVTPASVAKITASGLLTGVGPGTYAVTATTGTLSAVATGSVSNATLTSLAITPASPSITGGASQQFSATASFNDGSTQDVSQSVTWKSGNIALLSINTSGLAKTQVTKTAATVVVTAQLGSVTTTDQVSVNPVPGPPLTAVLVTPTASSVAKHTGQQLIATGYYADGSQADITNSVTWTSNNSAVSSVNAAGLVTTGNPGASTIQAQIVAPQGSSKRGVHGFATQTLQAQSVSLVTTATLVSLVADSNGSSVSPYVASINSTQQLGLSGTFSDGTKQDLTELATWQSLSPAIATVNAQGVATGVSVGSAQFTGSFGGLSATTPPLQITDAALQNVSISLPTQTLLIGVPSPVTLLGNFTDNSQQDLSDQATFQSSNPSVVTVETNGMLIGLTAGTATISGSAFGQSSSIEVAVASVTLQSITITTRPETPIGLALGTTKRFRALGNFSDGSSTDVTTISVWGSSNPAVFTVDDGGAAHAGSVGTAAVSASLLGVTQSSAPVPVTSATLTGLVVSPATVVLGLQTQQQFTAVGIFSDGTTEDLRDDVRWTTSDATVANVTSDGNATGVAAGGAQIVATLLGQTASTSSVSVTSALLTSTDLSPVNPTIALASNSQLFLTGTYSDGSFQDLTNCAQWTTSAPNIVYVNNSGLVNGTSPGTATVTALCGSDSVFTTITVVAKTLNSIAITPTQAQIPVGGAVPFELIGTFSDGSTEEIDEGVTWNTSDAGIGTLAGERAVVDGNTIGVSPGNSAISASYGTFTAPNAILHVTSKPLSSLQVTPANPALVSGTTQQFTAQATYTDGTGGDISGEVAWTSSNPSLVSIDQNGLATAHSSPSGGAVTITAVSGTFTASTTVQEPADTTNALMAISVVPTSSRIAIGTPQQLVALGKYANGTTQDISNLVTWTSSSPAIATVSSTGLATGLAAGTATLLAQSGMLQSPSTLIVDTATLVSLAISPTGATFANGTDEQFHLIGTFSDGSTQDLSPASQWSSSNPAAATISNTGLATGTGVGTAAFSGTFDGQTATTSPAQVTAATLVSITVQPSSASLAAGTSQQFQVIGTYSDGTTENLTGSATFQSSNPSVVNVSAAGLGEGVGVGTAQVTIDVDGMTVTTGSVTITPPTLSSISITPTSPHIAVGTNQAFTAIGTFSDGTTQDLTDEVVWASQNPSVATINQYGVAESGTAGTTQFSATYAGVTSTTNMVQVTQATLVSFSISPTTDTIAKGTTQQFTATGTFSDGSTENLTNQVTWSSSNGAALAINSAGLATGTGTGSASITATVDGQSQSTSALQVSAATLSSVAITPATASIGKGNTQQYTLTGTYSDGSMQDLSGSASWSSSNTVAAGINATGLATGASAGTATITGQSGSQSATVQLTISAATLNSVIISPTSGSIPLGTTQQFTATGTYSDGSTQNLSSSLTWLSSATSVLTIDSNGLATAVGQTGSSTITAEPSGGGAVYNSFTFGVTAAILSSIAVTPATASIAPNATQQYTATGTYTDNSKQDLSQLVNWSSSATGLATINSVGLATGVAAGTTTIHAQDGTVSSSNAMLTVASIAATPQSLVITPSSASISKGAQQQFAATLGYSDGTSVNVTAQTTWQSSATSVATINSSGLATGISAGSASITGTYNGLTGNVVLTVSGATLSSISVTPATASIADGTTQQFKATGSLSDGSTEDLTNSVDWSSTNTTDATISATGLATGHATGSVTIMASSGGVQNTATLAVTNATVSGLQVQPASISLAAGNTQQLLVTATFTDGSSQNVTQSSTYISSAPGVATVSSGGLVTTVSTGSSTVTVTLNSSTATVPVTVSSATLQSIAVTPANLTLAAGVGQQLTATGTYSDGSTANLTSAVTWTSSATGTLTVSSTGYATAIKAGNATVAATLNGVSGMLPVTVTNAVIQSISVTPGTANLAAGQTQQYTAIATLSDGTQQTVTSTAHWSVSDSTRASISNTSGSNGLLTAIASGTDTVSATIGSVSGTATVTITAATLSSLTITPTAFTLATGTTEQLAVSGTYSDGSSVNLTNQVAYTTSSQTTASVNATGLVTATGTTGVATIMATLGGQSATAAATVLPGTLLAIAVTPATTTIPDGQTQQFTATGTYVGNQQNITSQVQWTSSATAVATINTTGLATGVGGGTTTITATSGGTTGTTTLTVGSATLQSITVTAPENSFALGQTLQMTATGHYSDGSTQNLTSAVTWTSLNTAVGVVSNLGVANGVRAGVFGAQASLNGVSGSTPITVTNATLVSIALTPANKVIVNVTGGVQYTATGTFSDGTTQVLTTGLHWSLTATIINIGTISQTGLLSATSIGSGSVNVSYGTITASTPFTVVSLL